MCRADSPRDDGCFLDSSSPFWSALVPSCSFPGPSMPQSQIRLSRCDARPQGQQCVALRLWPCQWDFGYMRGSLRGSMSGSLSSGFAQLCYRARCAVSIRSRCSLALQSCVCPHASVGVTALDLPTYRSMARRWYAPSGIRRPFAGAHTLRARRQQAAHALCLKCALRPIDLNAGPFKCPPTNDARQCSPSPSLMAHRTLTQTHS